MEVLSLDERTLTELDHVRLVRLTRETHDPRSPEHAIDSVLDAARLLPARSIAPDVVTMYSQVEVADLATGRRSRLTVCYPSDAEPAAGFVSVLSPVGASLIGRRVGAVARWHTPSGSEGAAELVAVLFQPEASGDYTL